MHSDPNVVSSVLKWKSLLKADPTGWLLEESNPSVRYLTLRDILEYSESDPDVARSKEAIAYSRIVTKIFQKQSKLGTWESPTNLYTPKYKSTYWQIMILGVLGMSKDDPRVKKACDVILRYQLKEGGFSSHAAGRANEEYRDLKRKGEALGDRKNWMAEKTREHEYSCLTGNVVSALLRLGYTHNVQIERALGWLVSIQNRDGGWLCPYWKAHIRDVHSCFYGTICALEAFSEAKRLSGAIRKAAERGAEFLLMHRLFKADHHNFRIINRNWLKLSFPSFYGYDILRGLLVIGKLGYGGDERCNDALSILLAKQNARGRWILESTPTGRMHASLETKRKESKWMTLNAFRALKWIYSTRQED